jgi:AcrR family transcriptional regulator
MTQIASGERDQRKRTGQRRRSQSERSDAMKARLSEAAYNMVVEGGLKGLRVRSVAQAAGVSQGALLHHFPDKNAIILSAIEQALSLARQDSDSYLAKSNGGADALLRAMLTEFEAFFFSDRFWVAIGITIEASSDCDFFKLVKSRVSTLRKPVYDAWAERLVAAGWDAKDAIRDVRSGAAIISGLAIRRFWAENDTISDEIRDEWIAQRLPKS